MKLIDQNLFADGIEPWPNQVFQKDFDAYFLVSYPPYEYNENEVYNPFHLMNNIDEETIYIETPDGKKSMNHYIPRGTYEYDDYNLKFKTNLSHERFLVWQSENDQWAMLSDAKNKVAVIAVNWKIAHQIKFFYNQSLLSPNQFLQKVNLERHKSIFMKNYAPSKTLTEGNIENPIWLKYYFHCHVHKENDKLFYWKQFEQLYNATSKLLSFCKGLDMYADQAFQRRYWQNKMWYSSYSQAPVGGYQNYNLKNCEKVATKFLIENEHLMLDFEGKKEESGALYISNKKGLVNFFGFHIYGNLEKQKTKGGYADFNFNMCLHCHANKSVVHNQNFEFYFRETFLDSNDVKVYIEALKVFGFITKIYEVRMPKISAIYTNDKPLEITGISSFVPKKVTKSHPLNNQNQE